MYRSCIYKLRYDIYVIKNSMWIQGKLKHLFAIFYKKIIWNRQLLFNKKNKKTSEIYNVDFIEDDLCTLVLCRLKYV